MENQNNIDKYFRKLSEEQEPKTFKNMDKIWDKVEEKLDQKKQKRLIPLWKYAGVAASLLLLIGLGIRFIGNDTPVTTEQVVTIDEERFKEEIEKSPMEDAVVVEDKTSKTTNKITLVNPEVLIESETTFKNDKTTFDEEVTEIQAESFVSAKKSNVVVLADSTAKSDAEKTNYSFTYNIVAEKEIETETFAEKTITGTVISADDGLPLPGVSVVIQGTTRGTQTDLDGKYSLAAAIGETLEFSFLGMKSQEIKVGNTNVINVSLSPDYVIQAVVVESYGTRAKDVNLGSTTRIAGSPNYESSYVRSLQDQVPGINIATASGQPGGASPNIILRGDGNININSRPYYIVDGKLISEIKDFNPNDVEKYEIIKDEIISSDGTPLTNGVILVKTKKNKKKDFKVESGSVFYEVKKIILPPPFPERPKIEVNSESYENFTENPFESAASNPVSTFSIDVDNASYTNIRRFINNGQAVPKDAVRIEEMINFFKYDYPQPTGQHPFSIHTEYTDAPWNPDHKLLRIGLKGKEIPTDKLPKSNFVFLVDVSGSMDAPNKLPLLKASMKVLLDELRDDDRVSIVYYANNVGTLLEPTKAKEKQKIIDVIDKMYASGGTSGGAGLELAYQMAEKHFIKGGNNRVILATDGDFNIGKASDKEMQELIEEKRKSGVFLTCLGFGMGNYKDSKMMTLSKKGNGNYAYIDNIQEANRFLSKEFKGSMFAIAKDVKIQIEFNPAHVQAYRLIGYEMRKLRNEDFTNDAIDAGELGSGHTVTALYEVIPTGVKSDFYNHSTDLKYTQPGTVTDKFQNELATVKFRYKKPDGDKSMEMVHPISKNAVNLKNASKDFKFATAVAWFGLKLRDSRLVSNKESKEIIRLAKEGIQNDTDGYKAEFIRLVESVK